MFKKVLFPTLILATLIFAPVARAEESVVPSALPEVYVQDLKLDRSSYESGEEVQGTFVLRNYSPFDAPGMKYLISLGGDYTTGGMVMKEYDTAERGPVFVSAKEKKIISFSYRLPQGVAGEKLVIRIQAILPSGLPRGWADAPISLRGEATVLEVDSAVIRVGDRDFSLGAGPTIVGPKGGADIVVTLTNKSAAPLNTIPNLTIGSTTLSLAVVNLKAGETRVAKFALPTFDYTPAVYQGELRFVSQQGIQQTALLPLRYIIGGNMVKIHSLAAVPNSNLRRGQMVELTFGYSGSPYDITTDKGATPVKNKLSLELFNERDRSIGIYEEEMDFDLGNAKTVKIVTTDAAQTFRAVLTVRDSAGRELARHQTALSPVSSTGWPAIKLATLIFFLLIILVIIVRLAKRFYFRPQTVVKVGVLLFLLGVTLLAAQAAQAWTVTSNTTGGDTYKMVVMVNSPSPEVTPGQTFYLGFNVTAEACLNETGKLRLGVRYDNENVNYSTDIVPTWVRREDPASWARCTPATCTEWKNGEHYLRFFNLTFSKNGTMGTGVPFTAPTTPGTYRIYLRFANVGGGKEKGVITGYHEFTVVDRPSNQLAVRCDVSPTTISTLPGNATWTAYPSGGTPPYSYSWKFDSGIFGDFFGVSTIVKTYTANGIYSAAVKLRDSSSPQQTIDRVCDSRLTVNDEHFPPPPPPGPEGGPWDQSGPGGPNPVGPDLSSPYNPSDELDPTVIKSNYNLVAQCPDATKVLLGGKKYCPTVVNRPSSSASADSLPKITFKQEGSKPVSFLTDVDHLLGLPSKPTIPVNNNFGAPTGNFTPASIVLNGTTEFNLTFPDRGTNEDCQTSPYSTAAKLIQIIPQQIGSRSRCPADQQIDYPTPDGPCPSVALIYSDPRSCSR